MTTRIATEVAATAPFGATVLAIGDGALAGEIAAARPDLRVHRVAAGELAALPFDDQTVDLVVSAVPLHGRADAGVVLAELAGVLRAGGRIALYDPRPCPAPDLAALRARERPLLCPVRLYHQVRAACG